MDNKEPLKFQRLIPIKISSTSLLEICVLYFLKKNNTPTYGTQILTYIDDTFGTIWGPSHSNLYVVLSEMEKTQQIKSVYSDNKRIFYMITPSGAKALEEKLLENQESLVASRQFFDNIILTFYGNGVIV